MKVLKDGRRRRRDDPAGTMNRFAVLNETESTNWPVAVSNDRSDGPRVLNLSDLCDFIIYSIYYI